MADPAPITQFRQALKNILNAEFEDDELAVYDDRLAPSEGHDGPVAGVAPEAEATGEGGIDQTFLIAVEVHAWYDAQIDEHQRVDPAKIEDWSWRFQKRVAQASTVNTAAAWWFDIVRIDYPDDPTGNKTRFRALVQGHGENQSMPETAP